MLLLLLLLLICFMQLLKDVYEQFGKDAVMPKRSMKDRFGMFRFKTDGMPVKVAQVSLLVVHVVPICACVWESVNP